MVDDLLGRHWFNKMPVESRIVGSLKVDGFLLASQADVIVGSKDGDPHLLLRVGPIAGEHDAALIELLGPSLRCKCAPLPA